MNKRTKALQIPKAVKESVALRDSIDGYPCCVICGGPGNPDAHFIPRSKGGLGIEENIVTLCLICHKKYDQTDARKYIKPLLREHLIGIYPNWQEENLYYKR